MVKTWVNFSYWGWSIRIWILYPAYPSIRILIVGWMTTTHSYVLTTAHLFMSFEGEELTWKPDQPEDTSALISWLGVRQSLYEATRVFALYPLENLDRNSICSEFDVLHGLWRVSRELQGLGWSVWESFPEHPELRRAYINFWRFLRRKPFHSEWREVTREEMSGGPPGLIPASCRNYCMLFYIGFFMAGELICFSTLDTKFDRPTWPTESVHPIFGDFQTCSKISKLELERWEVWSLRFYESVSIPGNSDTL